jgi:hypothetical protein
MSTPARRVSLAMEWSRRACGTDHVMSSICTLDLAKFTDDGPRAIALELVGK